MALTALLLSGCLEEPVSERVEVRVPEVGPVEVAWQIDLRWGDPGVRGRLLALEGDLLGGRSTWEDVIRDLEPEVETSSWKKEDGRLQLWRRTAEIPFDRLPDVLGRTTAQWVLEGTGEAGGLTLFLPDVVPSRRSDRRRVEGALDDWSDALYAHLRRLEALYRALEERPELALLAFRLLFEDESVEIEEEELPAEVALPLKEVADGMSAPLELFDVQAGVEESWEELSRRVFDPLPADLRLALEAEARAVSGWEEREGAFWAPRTTLWRAWLASSGTWASPEPLSLWVQASLGGQELDTEAIAAMPRRAEAPLGVGEIRSALRAALRPPSELRVEWGAR